jgi:hypothetical protein
MKPIEVLKLADKVTADFENCNFSNGEWVLKFSEALLHRVWCDLDKMIVRGELQGNGCDMTAQRNGIILAANLVFNMEEGLK